MISEHHTLQLKVEEYFNLLRHAFEHNNYSLAETYLCRLSELTHMFTADQQDFYELIEKFLDEADDDYYEHYHEPTEQDEWFDFDPDC